jgi:L-alanine-DL-glutamate epimerase-like enolase superfamily enzyme
MRLICDLNFNYRTEGFKRFAKALEPFNMMWLEMDSLDAKGLAHIRQSSSTPIGSLETVIGGKALRPYLEERCVDVAIIDPIYNGLPESLRMASMCDAYEINVASHAFAGPLASVMSAHFCAVLPNFRIMDLDVDESPWCSSLLTNPYRLENGSFVIPKGLGWGTDVDEAMLIKHRAS